MATEKPKRQKTQGNNQISEELIKAGGRTSPSEIHKLDHSISNKVELGEEWKGSIIAPIYIYIRSAIKQTVEIVETYYFCQVRTNFYPISCSQG